MFFANHLCNNSYKFSCKNCSAAHECRIILSVVWHTFLTIIVNLCFIFLLVTWHSIDPQNLNFSNFLQFLEHPARMCVGQKIRGPYRTSCESCSFSSRASFFAHFASCCTCAFACSSRCTANCLRFVLSSGIVSCRYFEWVLLLKAHELSTQNKLACVVSKIKFYWEQETPQKRSTALSAAQSLHMGVYTPEHSLGWMHRGPRCLPMSRALQRCRWIIFPSFLKKHKNTKLLHANNCKN